MHLYEIKDFPALCGSSFDCKFPKEMINAKEITIEDAPNLFEIIRNARWTEHTAQDCLVFYARLLFPSSLIPAWKLVVFNKGVSRAGKSTLIDMVSSLLYLLISKIK